jgi:outer membrane protein TolC
MKRIIPFLFTIVLQLNGLCQQTDTLRIEECFRIAGEKSPLQRQKTISGEALSYKIRNLNTNWLPAIGFNAQAIYNSETIDFSDIIKDLPVSLPSLPLDQYKVWADINQQLYDGGMVKAQKEVEKASYEAGIQQVETDLRGIKQQVSQVYFSLLVTRKSKAVLQVTLDELKERKKVIQAGMDNGVVLPENLLVLEAEELKLQQNLTELNLTQLQLFKVLSILMDTTLMGNTEIAEPFEPKSFNDQINRPEYLLFEKQKEAYKANQKLVSASDLPRIFAFSQAAYGRPGYNIVSNDFHTFYSVGLGMKWNFLNYGDNRRLKKILDIQQGMVDIRHDTFDDQLKVQLETENTNIEKYNELLHQDEQILKLRKAIAITSLSKLTNGVITSADYLTDLNAEILAKLQYENHKILKLQAAYNYMILKGQL